ncbi:MAG TPA: hypothetical protein VM779_01515 [Thermoanaerobaculia bacterium]|nr:hypothetical protein [Thermoanaerobaculia bacterium]
MMSLHSARIASLLFFVPLALSGATYLVPPDADLVRQAETIAVVTIQSSHSHFTGEGAIVTDYPAVVERGLKGVAAAGSSIIIRQAGGVVGDVGLAVSGQPSFQPGERALLMLRQVGEWRFTTIAGELGKFSFVLDAASRPLLVRGATTGEIFGWDVAGRRHSEGSRDAAAFLRYIEEVAAGGRPPAGYFVEAAAAGIRRATPDSHVPGNDYMMLFEAGSIRRGSRWPTGSFTTESVGTQSGVSNLAGSIGTARGVWNGAPNASISIGYAGPTSGGTYGENDGRNLMFFDQPDSGPLAGSVVGQATVWASSATNTNGGDTYFTTVDCDIIVESGFTGTTFEAILAHELGHCLGFRHSNEPQTGQVTFTTDALMNASVASNYALRAWDQDAASHVYGSGASSCTPPSITTQPQSATIQAGQTATLSVGAAGTAPLSYQWYVGSSGDTSRPISGATSSSITVAPTTTTDFWVRVSGQCGTPVNSATARVTVATCTPPSITSQPQSTTIQAGQTATLSVAASGTAPLSYQWYVGSSGDTSRPLDGAVSTGIVVAPAVTTSFWVRVSGQCGTPVNSATATVTVTAACAGPAITSTTPSQTIRAGSLLTLTLTASGTAPLQYAWFEGPAGDTSRLAGSSASITVGPLLRSTRYWVRVTNACGEARSGSIEITVANVRRRAVRR